MALTVSQQFRTVPGGDTLQVQNVALDNSYPTGGYTVTPAQLGLNVLKAIVAVNPANIAAGAFEPIVLATYTNGVISQFKLALTVSSTGVQVANAVDVSAATFAVAALGS